MQKRGAGRIADTAFLQLRGGDSAAVYELTIAFDSPLSA
jgi:hypothetical protein